MEEAELTHQEYASMQSAVYQDLTERMDAIDDANAQLLLAQAEAQESQEETLAQILLNQAEGEANEQNV